MKERERDRDRGVWREHYKTQGWRDNKIRFLQYVFSERNNMHQMWGCYASSIFKQNHFSFFCLIYAVISIKKKKNHMLAREIVDYNIHKQERFNLLFIILF